MIKDKFKKNISKRKLVLTSILFLLLVLSIWGFSAVLAYYNSSSSFAILGTSVGNFDVGDADVVLLIYAQSNENEDVYNLVSSIPSYAFYYNSSKTTCSNSSISVAYNSDSKTFTVSSGVKGVCNVYFDSSAAADVTLKIYVQNDTDYELAESAPTYGYYYNSDKTTCTSSDTTITYDIATSTFKISAQEQDVCNVYFEALSEADVVTYILLEDDTGDYYYSSKYYTLSEFLPAYGYEYVGYSCQNTETAVTYDNTNKTFSYSTTMKNLCYAYFDSVSDSDITVNIYVQDRVGSTTYQSVVTIPTGNTYVLNSTYTTCLDKDSTSISGNIVSYTNGTIKIESEEIASCDVYLDIES